MSDFKKKLLNLAYKIAQEKYVEQTGLVHHCYELPNEKITQPIYENFLFALILFEKKEKDLFLQGKNVLSRLFAFQKRGGFCSYIHEFPHPNVGLSFRLLPIFRALDARFSPLFDHKFQKVFIKAKHALETYVCKQMQTECTFIQRLLFHGYFHQEKELNELFFRDELWRMSPTKMKSQMLIAISQLDEIPQKSLDSLFSFYDPDRKQSIQPYFNELFLHGEAMPSIFSAMQKIYFGEEKIEPFHGLMQIPLIHEDIFKPHPAKELALKKGDDWQVIKTQDYVLTSIEREELDPRRQKGFHPFCLFLQGNALILQESDVQTKVVAENPIQLSIQKQTEIEVGECFCHFYLFNDPSLRAKISGQTTSVFYPGQTLQLEGQNFSLQLRIESEHQIIGHVGFGKKPSEVDANHVDRMIYFRAIEPIHQGKFTIYLECAVNEAESSATAMACMPLST